MRTGISFEVSPADRHRLETLLRDRNTAQKHVWRAEIILLSGDGVGTMEIMRRMGTSKTCVWRWQERFMPHTAFDKDQRVTHAAITENKHLGAVLEFIKDEQDKAAPKKHRAGILEAIRRLRAPPSCA